MISIDEARLHSVKRSMNYRPPYRPNEREKLPTLAQQYFRDANPYTKAAGNFQARQPVLRIQAAQHEINRLGAVAETLGLIGILSTKGIISGHEVVTTRGARFQWVSGEGGMVAAHCLPGWLNFNGQLINQSQNWTVNNLVERGLKPIPIDRKLWNLGAMIDLVDPVVNHSDSNLERMTNARGLKPVLARSVSHLLTRLRHRQPRDSHTLAEQVADAVEYYRFHADLACEERLEWYQEQLRKAIELKDAQSLQERTTVVSEYLHTLQNPAVVLEFATPTGFGKMYHEVVASGPGGTFPTESTQGKSTDG